MRALPLLVVAACAGNPGGPSRLDRVPKGDWGGQHVLLTVGDAGSTIQYDCAHGTFDDPLLLDAGGHFDVKGHLVAEGGPIRKDEPARARSVRYRGETDGQQMRLQLTLDGGEDGGTFSLTKGAPARLVKCR